MEIYGIFNSGLIIKLYDVKNNILNNDENQIMDVFYDYYKELNEWLNSVKPISDKGYKDDLPF